MKLHPTGALDPDSSATTFRHSPFTDLFVAIVMAALLAGGGIAIITKASSVPASFWIFLGPMAVIGGLILTVLVITQLGAFRSSLTDANWLARVDHDGIFLNLRSYRNRHFGGEDPTVVRIDFSAIRSAGKVTEVHVERRGNKRRMVHTRTIELILDEDTTALATAVRAERQRTDPRKGKGDTSSLKHHHVLVFVPEPGVVRIEWHAKLFQSLLGTTTRAPERHHDLDEDLRHTTPEERALVMAQRGRQFMARRILTEQLDMDKDTADQWLENEAA